MSHPALPGNPCPILRALVAQGLRPDGSVECGMNLHELTRTMDATCERAARR